MSARIIIMQEWAPYMLGGLWCVSVQIDGSDLRPLAWLKTEGGAYRRGLREAKDRGCQCFIAAAFGREIELKEGA